MTHILKSLAEVADRYDAVFCDLWGCLHNGVQVYPAAAAALDAFRDKGGVTVLLTNAPRPHSTVRAQLERMGASEALRAHIVSSGDAARASVAAGEWGGAVFHIGADKDEPFFDNLEVARVGLDAAESVVVTGLRDDRTETPDDYREVLERAEARGLRLLCANPDIVVDMGDVRLWCAGALAQLYENLGGETVSYGKPYGPIYAHARAAASAAAGRRIEDSRILCVGDGVGTDILGAAREGLDSLFVTGGLAAEEMGVDVEHPEPARLAAWLEAHGVLPTYAIGRLR